MYIELRAINRIGQGGSEFELPSEIIRYLEFKDTVLFLLNAEKQQNHIVAIKYRDVDPHEFYITWEFKYRTYITGFARWMYNEQDCLRIRTWDDIIFIIDPNDGHIIDDFPTHG
jgi:hypothetical protein